MHKFAPAVGAVFLTSLTLAWSGPATATTCNDPTADCGTLVQGSIGSIGSLNSNAVLQYVSDATGIGIDMLRFVDSVTLAGGDSDSDSDSDGSGGDDDDDASDSLGIVSLFDDAGDAPDADHALQGLWSSEEGVRFVLLASGGGDDDDDDDSQRLAALYDYGALVAGGTWSTEALADHHGKPPNLRTFVAVRVVPLPGALWLLLGAMGGLATLRRKSG